MSERKEQWVSATSKYDDGYQHGWHNGYQNETEEHAVTIATQSAQIEELRHALEFARPYLAAQLQQAAHVCGDPAVAKARNDLVLIDRALSTISDGTEMNEAFEGLQADMDGMRADPKDARIAKLTRILGVLPLIEVDLTAGDIPAKTRVALALSRVRAAIASVEGENERVD